MPTRTALAALPRRRPGTEGVDPAGITAFLTAVSRDLGGLHGFMLLRHGRVLAEGAWSPYAAELPHLLFSLTKSFSSTAILAGLGNMQAVLDRLWAHLLPAFGPVPRPPAPAAGRELRQTLAALSLPVAAGEPTSPLAAGLAGATFHFAANPRHVTALTLRELGAGGCVIDLTDAAGEHRIAAAHGRWLTSTTTLEGRGAAVPLAGSCGWTAPDTLQIKLCYRLTPFSSVTTLRFTGNRLLVQRRVNVSFGPVDTSDLEGERL